MPVVVRSSGPFLIGGQYSEGELGPRLGLRDLTQGRAVHPCLVHRALCVLQMRDAL